MAAKKKQTKATASARATAPQPTRHGQQFKELFADVMAHTRISRKQLATMLGTDLATLDALELGIVTPRGALLRALLPLFEVQRSYHKKRQTQ